MKTNVKAIIISACILFTLSSLGVWLAVATKNYTNRPIVWTDIVMPITMITGMGSLVTYLVILNILEEKNENENN